MILLKRIFILIYIPIIFFSFLILFSDIYGSPFYLILTEKRISTYIDRNYTTLEIGDVFYDGEYKATIYDKYGDSYIMTYDISKDKVNDTYYTETVAVMSALIRNNIRQLLNFNDININIDEIKIHLSIPMYVYEVGEIGSGDECECNLTIELPPKFQSSISFGKEAFIVFKSLKYSLIKINELNVIGYSENGKYYVKGDNKIYPADEETTIILTQYESFKNDRRLN